MADIVRLNKNECDASISRLKGKLDELRQYIAGPTSSTVSSMSNWWIGAAYEAFKDDFVRTKDTLETKVMQEVDDYIERLRKAVEAQQAQDMSNAGSIGING